MGLWISIIFVLWSPEAHLDLYIGATAIIILIWSFWL